MTLIELKRGALAPRLIALVSLLAIAAITACAREGTEGPDLSGEMDLAAEVDQAEGTPPPDMACTPEVTSCSGLCGPVRDNCTGMTYQCGACAAGTVCDLDSHLCITPKKDCAELGRVCGTTKNSCGQTISCSPFTCTDTAQECDPDTNQCVACTNVTCEDLGYECGVAWLGCGPQSNTTDCGGCDVDKNCNLALHVCEPKTGGVCGGMTAQQMCDAAKAASGVECGAISNGCGDLIDCTATDPTNYKCRPGLTCGGAGVPNRCAPAEPPTECYAAGYNCGDLDSACGGKVHCGDCDPSTGDVCNLAPGSTAGICGPACTMPTKSCAVDYAGQCGINLNNNCWPALSCPCGPGEVCSTDATPGTPGTCGNAEMCSAYTTGADSQPCSTQPSTAFPKGDGSNLTCDCMNAGANPGQEVCINIDGTTKAGTCCTRTACVGSQATVTDACTGATLNCCSPGQVAYMGNCCTPDPNPCESAANMGKYVTGVTDGCGNPKGRNNGGNNNTGVCDCNRYAATPVDPDIAPTNGVPDNGGTCCAAATCSNGSGSTYCDGRVTTATCNPSSTNTCNIGDCTGSGPVCNGGLCCVPTPCPNDGKYHAAWDPGCGQAPIVCDCSRFSSSSQKVDPDLNNDGTIDDGGTCCATPTCGNNCGGGQVAATCNAAVKTAACTTCASNKCCSGGTTCISKNTCSGTYSGKCGQDLDDGCGNDVIDCNCTSPATCTTSNPGMTGTCNCPPVTCVGCSPGTQTNACGNSKDCSCNGGKVCGSGNACCTPLTCADLPMGWECGQVSDTCTGSNIPCNCPTATMPLNTCNGTSHLCECTPIKCCKDTGGVEPCIQPGAYSPSLGYPDHNDGCGGSGTCSS